MQNGLTELTHQQMQAQHPAAYAAWPTELSNGVIWHVDAQGTLHAESFAGWPYVWDPDSSEWDAM